jgi:hypothetical protein
MSARTTPSVCTARSVGPATASAASRMASEERSCTLDFLDEARRRSKVVCPIVRK